MGKRTVMTACMAIAVLAAIVAPVGAAHAQGDDGGIKGGVKFGISQAVDPSDKITEALDRAESQACDLDPHSPACPIVTVTANGVNVILTVAAVTAVISLVLILVRHLPF